MGRNEVLDICNQFLNKREERDKVQEYVERCLRKGYDYERLRDKILSYVPDTHKAHKMMDAFVKAFPQLRKRTRFEESKDSSNKERDRRDDRDRDRDRRDRDREPKDKRSRHERSEEEENRQKELDMRHKVAVDIHQKKMKEEEEERARNDKKTLTEADIMAKELMYKAQQEIEERKRKANISVHGIPQEPLPVKNVTIKGSEASMYINLSMGKMSRMDELKAKLANRSSTIASLQNKAPVKTEPAPIAKQEPVRREEKVELVEYLDPRISARPANRSRRANFNFVEQGDYQSLANKQRAKAKLDKLQAEISSAAKATGISSAVKLAMVTPAGASRDDVPDMEWWDAVVLEKDTYDDIPSESEEGRYAETISELIEHPIQLRPPTEPDKPQYLKVYLTTKERKKIRRQNRKEAQKEEQEKIRLGLKKAPEPKVKLSNLMRVLGNDAVQDPTRMEAHVRKQMADRLKKHEKDNADRKLTDEQRSAKKTKKISEDTSLAVHVAIYRIKSLLHPAKKFKVEMNAKQLQMTGVILLHKDINVVVVEGGPKQHKFYKNLMMNRMKWEDEVIGEKKAAEKDAPGERNECRLIWEGTVKKRNFGEIKCVAAAIEKQAREVMDRHNVPHYWDLCYSTTVLADQVEQPVI